MTEESSDFISLCAAHLERTWDKVINESEQRELQPRLGPNSGLSHLIKDCLTSRIKTYHYVLPTQLLAKAVNPALDAHCVQVAFEQPGAFDARSLAHKVIVPFDQNNYRVLRRFARALRQ